MHYKAISVLKIDGKYYGLRVLNELNDTLDLDSNSIIELVKAGFINNLSLIKDKDSENIKVKGIENLPVKNLQKVKTRHQQAKEFLMKLKLLGDNLRMDLEYLEFDRVALKKVYSDKPLDRLVIPSFITDVIVDQSFENFQDTVVDVVTNEILIDNPKDAIIDISALFSYSDFDEIKVKLAHPEMVIRAKGLFAYSALLRKIELINFKTTNLIEADMMFSGCVSINEINLGDLCTDNAESLYSMFNDCIIIEHLDISNIRTSKVKNFSRMFSGCHKLKSIDLSKFDTANAQKMSRMFAGCYDLDKLDLSNFNTANTKNMAYMFMRCVSLSELDLSNFDTSNVDNMSGMFCLCSNLDTLNISSFNTSRVKSMNNMFKRCLSLDYLDFSNFNTENLQNTISMFEESGFIELNLSTFKFKKVKEANVINMFRGCMDLVKLNIKNMYVSEVDVGLLGLYKSFNLEEIDLSGLTEGIHVQYIIDMLSRTYAKRVLVNKELEADKIFMLQLSKSYYKDKVVFI